MAKTKALASLLIFYTLIAASLVHSDVLIDPTRPSTSSKQTSLKQETVPSRRLILESTLVAPNRRIAVVNGKLVREGDSVDGARVITIRKSVVLVETSSRRITLHLLPDIVKRKP